MNNKDINSKEYYKYYYSVKPILEEFLPSHYTDYIHSKLSLNIDNKYIYDVKKGLRSDIQVLNLLVSLSEKNKKLNQYLKLNKKRIQNHIEQKLELKGDVGINFVHIYN